MSNSGQIHDILVKNTAPVCSEMRPCLAARTHRPINNQNWRRQTLGRLVGHCPLSHADERLIPHGVSSHRPLHHSDFSLFQEPAPFDVRQTWHQGCLVSRIVRHCVF